MFQRLLPVFCLVCLTTLAIGQEANRFADTWTEPSTGAHYEKLGEYRYVYKYFFKLYDVVLYVEAGADAEAVLNRSAGFHLEFRYLREIERSIILESADKMLAKNLTDEKRSAISDSVEALNEVYQTVAKGDRSSLTYVPENGTTFRLNGNAKLTIPSEKFAQDYFSIWLGESPISADMKATLLGKSI